MKKKSRKPRLLEGLPVVDADGDVTLTVTKADVRASKMRDPGECAAAKAGQRELKKEVKVFLSRMYVKDKNKWVRFITPISVSREITSFDRGATFEPGEYKFKAPSEHVRLGTHREHGAGNGKKSGKRGHVTENVRIRANY